MKSLLLLLLLAVSPDPAVPCRVGCKAVGKHMLISVPPAEGGEYVNIDIRSKGKQLKAIYAINNNWFYVWTDARRGIFTAELNGRRIRGRWSRLKPFRWRY